MYSRKQLQYLYLILQVSHLSSLCPYLHLILGIHSERLLARFDHELAINLALSKKLQYVGYIFLTSSLFLSILVTSFSIGTVTHPACDVVATSQLGLI